MYLAKDVSSLKRLWLAIESRYKNRQSYYQNQVELSQIQRIDQQLQITIYAMVCACPQLSWNDIGLPDVDVNKPESVFFNITVRWQRESSLGSIDFSDDKIFDRPDIVKSIVEAFLFLPDDQRQPCFEQLFGQIDEGRKKTLAQYISLYLMPDQRSAFLFKSEDFLLAACKVECKEKLDPACESLLSLLPYSSALVRLCGGGASLTEIQVLLDTEPNTAQALLSTVSEPEVTSILLDAMHEPRYAELAYSSWLYRTGLTLPLSPLLKDSNNSSTSAGPDVVDTNKAREQLALLSEEERQGLSRYLPDRLNMKVSSLDDCLWIVQGGFAKTGQLIGLLPYSKRQSLLSQAELWREGL